jgi:hypothetical protein
MLCSIECQGARKLLAGKLERCKARVLSGTPNQKAEAYFIDWIARFVHSNRTLGVFMVEA